MNNKLFFGLLILAAGFLTGWYFLNGDTSQFTTTTTNQSLGTISPTAKINQNGSVTTTPSSASGEMLEKGGAKERKVITYTDTGFAPEPITVTKGTTVTFVNESNRGMWVASAMHPTHQLLPGFDQLSAATKGSTYEYTFIKVGTWKYHNHVNPADTGSIIVTE
jgi:plastocyanin